MSPLCHFCLIGKALMRREGVVPPREHGKGIYHGSWGPHAASGAPSVLFPECVGPILLPPLCLCYAPAPWQANFFSSGCSGLYQAPTFLTTCCPSDLQGPPMEHKDPSCCPGHSHPLSTPAQPQPDSLCMTVSLVYSSISPWMRRNRGIFPLNSCFRIVEYTSSPGHSGRGTGKGRQLLEVPPPHLGHWTWSWPPSPSPAQQPYHQTEPGSSHPG